MDSQRSWYAVVVRSRQEKVAAALVEANMRTPALPRMLGTTNHYGLTESLVEDHPIRNFAKPVANEKLWLLSSGSLAVDSPNLLSSERMKARSQELRQEFDYESPMPRP